MNIELTSKADALICSLYKKYLERLQSGDTESKARFFGSSEIVRSEIVPSWNFGDVDETCKQLSRADLMTCLCADDIVYSNLKFTDLGVIYMEKRFERNLLKILDYIKKIPFL